MRCWSCTGLPICMVSVSLLLETRSLHLHWMQQTQQTLQESPLSVQVSAKTPFHLSISHQSTTHQLHWSLELEERFCVMTKFSCFLLYTLAVSALLNNAFHQPWTLMIPSQFLASPLFLFPQCLQSPCILRSVLLQLRFPTMEDPVSTPSLLF